MRLIKNSSGKTLGWVELTENSIIINNDSKPVLVIDNQSVLDEIRENPDNAMKILYDEYTLTIGEIAAIFNTKYFKINAKLKEIGIESAKKSGRRNSSYSATFSDTRRANMSKALRGKPGTYYERTPEIREKISATLKEGYREGRIVQDPKLKIDAWKRGRYKTANMGTGICGSFNSIKMNYTFHFKSMLELWVMLVLESDPWVFSFVYEPLTIPIDDTSIYIPDFLINAKYLVEVKAKDTVKFRGLERFNKEMEAMKKYCAEHEYIASIIYDKDLHYSTRAAKKYFTAHPEIISKYDIKFEKGWSLK